MQQQEAAADVRGLNELQVQLRALSFLEPVGLESAALVRHLLAEFQSLSDARERGERALAAARREALEAAQALLPLRKENAALTRENNSLHLEIIHQEEAVAEREKACELQLQGLRDDVARLQFLAAQKTQQVALKEQELAKLQVHLERVVALGADASGTIERRGSGAFSAADLQLRSPPRKAGERDAQVLATLQRQVDELSGENARLHAQLGAFGDKLQKRELEINRLAKLSAATAGSSHDDAARRLREQDQRHADQAAQDAADLRAEQLQAQVDLLNGQVAKYEARLKDAADEIRRNDALAEKLRQTSDLNDKCARELSALQAKYQALEDERFRAPTPASAADDRVDGPAARADDASATSERVESLKEQIAGLAAHRDRLEDALRATHYDKISYTNALSNANSHNRVLATDLARAESKVLELTSSVAGLQQAAADAAAALASQTREREVLAESLKQSEDNKLLETEKNASLHRELRAMDKVLAQRDDECRALNHSLLSQKAEVDRLTSKAEALASSLAAGDGDGDATATAGGRRAVVAHEIKWLEEERQELRDGKEQLLRQVLQLQEELQSAKSAVQRSELDKDTLAQQLDGAAKLQASVATALEDKKSECLALERKLAASKEQVRELQGRVSQSQVLLHRADDTENEKLQVQSEALALRKLVEELRDRNASLTHRIENDDAHASRLTAQAGRTQEQLALAQKASASLAKELAELKRSYESTTLELRSARQVCSHYQNEYEKLAQELQSQQHSLSSEQSALQSSQSSLSELRGQVRQLQSELGLKQSTVHQLQTRLDQEKLALKAAQSELALLHDEVLQLRETTRARDVAVTQLRDDAQTRDRALTEKSEAVENLKLLIEQVEASRDQVLFRAKTQQQQLQRHAQETADLQAKIALLDKDALAKGVEVAALKKLTRTLDAERDNLTDQLDALTEKFHEASEQNAQLRAGAQSESASSDELRARVEGLVSQLHEREDDVRRLQARSAQLEAEVDRLEHAKGMLEAEMAALAQDLENMTIENQALSEECTRLQVAHQSQAQSTSGLRQAVRLAERERDTLAVELEDLRHTYRSLIHEHDGVERARSQVAELHEELAVVNEALRTQVATLENENAVVAGKNATLATEVATYREQVSYLTDKLQASEQTLSDRESRQHDLQHELETQRQISTEISAQRYGAQAQSAAVSQRIVHLEAKLSHSAFETRALQAKLETEQSERRALEGLVATLREKVAANDTLIGHLEEQRQAMAQEIQASHQRHVAGNAVMEMSELSHRPLDGSGSSHASSRDHEVSPLAASRETPPSDADRGLGNSAASSSSILPLRSLEAAQRKCKELEDRLTQQDDTIKQLERSRSKFKRFAVKYEREIEQRDRLITELRSSNASSLVSPELRAGHERQRSRLSSSSSSSSSSTVRRSQLGANAVGS